jgi:predicted DNA binding CopG/RHH family protein
MSNKDKRYYDEEEKYLIDSIENEEWNPIDNKENKLEEAVDTANKTIRKEKRMNIRISERDLKNLKIKALEEGIPYQTLVSMILHKYVTGKLKESVPRQQKFP